MKTMQIGAMLGLVVMGTLGCKGSPTPGTPPPPSPNDATTPSNATTQGDAAEGTTTGAPPANDTTSAGPATNDASSASASTGSGAAKLERGVCEAIGQQVGAKLKTIRDKNVACKTAHDCEIISSGMCNLSVGCGIAVSLGKGREVERLSDEATRDQCKTWNDGGCPTTMAIPIPSCPQMSPICQGGKCSQIPATR